jgi:hypothetical protein
MRAASNAACAEAVERQVREIVARETFGERFVTKVLGRQQGLV